MKTPPRKILLIRFSSIGDIVLTSPIIRCLRQQTGAELHFLTKQANLPLLEANPYLSKVFIIEKKVQEVLPALRQERYDCIVDLHKNWRSHHVRWALGVKALTFNKLNIEKWLLVNLKLDLLPRLHLVDRYFEAFAPLGITNDGQGLDYFIPTVDGPRPAATVCRGPWAAGRLPYVAFAIGAQYATKRLPTDKIVEFCKAIEQPVILLGGKGEEAEGEKVASLAGGHVTNFCGKLSLHQSATVLRDADWVLTHDTGMMHIAAAFRKKIVSIWGNTVPVFGMSPYLPQGEGESKMLEVEGLGCRPCSKIGHGACPKGHFRCMKEQRLLLGVDKG